jgi:hypothetical protein
MQYKPVQQALQAHFDIDVRRLEFISRFLIALLKVRSVNLTQIATALNGRAKLESNARRIKRFLNLDFAQDLIARFVLSFVIDEKLVLTMDRFLPLTAAPDGLGAHELEVRIGPHQLPRDRHCSSRHRSAHRLGESRKSRE